MGEPGGVLQKAVMANVSVRSVQAVDYKCIQHLWKCLIWCSTMETNVIWYNYDEYA